MKITLGISPCPNDTFMFYHLLHSNQFNIELTIADVEELNHRALTQELDISKVSFYAVTKVTNHYTLLESGAALGENCGPLLVTKEKGKAKQLSEATIGIPGRYTTANLLFSLYGENRGQKRFMSFESIMQAVKEGTVDFGVIIHEGRFTYKNYGLSVVVDLGEWWEHSFNLPLPLGGIIAKRSLPVKFVEEFNQALHDSISKAMDEKEDFNAPLYAYVRKHAQEMDLEVIKKHIELYVNHYSLRLDAEGNSAIRKLSAMVKEYNL